MRIWAPPTVRRARTSLSYHTSSHSPPVVLVFEFVTANHCLKKRQTPFWKLNSSFLGNEHIKHFIIVTTFPCYSISSDLKFLLALMASSENSSQFFRNFSFLSFSRPNTPLRIFRAWQRPTSWKLIQKRDKKIFNEFRTLMGQTDFWKTPSGEFYCSNIGSWVLIWMGSLSQQCQKCVKYFSSLFRASFPEIDPAKIFWWIFQELPRRALRAFCNGSYQPLTFSRSNHVRYF